MDIFAFVESLTPGQRLALRTLISAKTEDEFTLLALDLHRSTRRALVARKLLLVDVPARRVEFTPLGRAVAEQARKKKAA